MQGPIKFSILTPVYNVEKFLDQCIQSVICQTYQNFELILVDDGSTDESGKICDRYARENNCINVFHKPNAGLLHTRRFAFSKASGDYYVILDSDDYLEPNTLEVIYNAISQYNCDCVIYGLKRVLDGRTLQIQGENFDFPQLVEGKREIYKRVFFDAAYNSLCRKAFKSTLLAGQDYSAHYYVKHGEDLFQSIEIIERASRVVFLPDILYNYRLNPNSITQTIRYDNYSVDFTVREAVLKCINDCNMFQEMDYIEYRSYAIWLIIKEIEIIAGFKVDYARKEDLFEQIRNHAYYRDFILGGPYNRASTGKKSIVFELFNKKQYRLVLAVVIMLREINKWRK